jgi:hypothetical protein
MNDPSATSTLDSERRRGRIVGVVALISVVSVWGTVVFANSGNRGAGRPAARLGETGFDRVKQLLDFDRDISDQAIAAGLRCFGLLLTIAVGIYLYSLIRARNPAVPRAIFWCALIGPVVVCCTTVFGFFALRDVADAFASSGPRTAERAKRLVNDSGALQASGILDILSRLVFAAWVGWASLEAMRVGLLTRFLGYWGIGAAGALVLLPLGDAMFIGWLASIGILALGYWPGGRPPAWQSTQPLPAE